MGAEQKPQTTTYISAVTRECDNVPAMLKELAETCNVRASQIDFSIISTQTLIKLPEHDRPVELTPQLIGRVSDEKLLYEKDFYIRQIHKITFRPVAANNQPANDLKLDVEVAANKSRTKAIATILPTSKLHNFATLREYLIEELNKLKLRYGMILGMRDGAMLNDINTLINKMRVHDRLKEPFKVTLCEWVAPIPTVHDNLVLHYKGKDAPKESERIDYAERGFIQTAEIGDLLIEYVKPKEGVPGRDFRGVFIPAMSPKVRFMPVLEPDMETIEVREDDRSIRYYAKQRGYIVFRKVESKLYISDKMEITSADFKTTGNISAGTDKDIKIKIRGSDPFEDHVGPNTKIEASEIDITGSVANGAQIVVEKLIVQGQTHSTSVIVAKDAHIAVHKGTLDAETAKIDRLEHGKVNAENVEVDRVIGGTIRARKIFIGTLHSYATLIASERIEIGQLIGGENRFLIEPAASKLEHNYFLTLIEDNKVAERAVSDLAARYNKKCALLLRNKDQMTMVRNRIEEDRENRRIPPSIFIDRYKQYLEETKKAQLLLEELKEAQTRQSKMQDEINAIQSKVLSAVIINQDIWRNYNEIKFRMFSPPKDLVFVPEENTRTRTICLVQTGLEDYVIKALN
ncbi:MAG: FapA family protein [Helicobacteraceae bacterium]|jgi:hypothetical protein|nr:FapA family protein [Helicobacteraceae bacterium]